MLTLCLMLLEGEEDRALFVRFHAKYEKKLYAVALKILGSGALAEEAVQESMVKIAVHFETFRKIYEKNCNEIAPWCITLVKRAALDLLRRERRSAPLDEDWEPPARESTEEESAYRCLVELIRAMPETYRTALELKFVLEWSNREIARALNISENAAAVRIARGRAMLIERLREEGYELERV